MLTTPDDILGMALFVRVVECGSFSDAARAFGLSKSAVSTRVSRLEKRFGVQLIHRTTRKMTLTADGMRFYERCARVVAEADEAARVVAGASAEPRGLLRVRAPVGLAERHLAKPIRELMRCYPGIRIDLRLSEHLPDLSADPFDVALVVAGRLADSGLTTKKLATVRVVVCAAPEYLRRKGTPLEPQDLVRHDCIAHSIRQTTEDWRFQTPRGAVSPVGFSTLVVDSATFVRRAALEGLGVAMLAEYMVAEDLPAGRLLPILEGYETIELGIHLLHPHGRLPPASVRAFIKQMTQEFRRPPWRTR